MHYSLVGVSVEFGTLGGMLTGYSRQVQYWLVHYSLVGVSAEFDTLEGKLIGYSH